MRIIPEKPVSALAAGDSLRRGGLRITRPRRLILECVRATDGHPTAAWVYRHVRRRDRGVSLGTVYRNLRQLVDAGLLVERPDTAGSRFDGNLAEHDHFTCLACGRIYDLEPMARARAPTARPKGFTVYRHRIEYFGRCPACRSPRARRARCQARP